RNVSGDTSRKNASDSTISTTTIPTVVRIDTALQRTSSAPIQRSRRCRATRPAAPGVGEPRRPAAATGATGALLSATVRRNPSEVLLILLGWSGHVPDLADQRRRVLHVEAHELRELRTLELIRVHVDEQRPGERCILTARHGLGCRLHAAIAVVDADRAQPALILDVVCVAEVPERVHVATDTLHEHVVVLT